MNQKIKDVVRTILIWTFLVFPACYLIVSTEYGKSLSLKLYYTVTDEIDYYINPPKSVAELEELRNAGLRDPDPLINAIWSVPADKIEEPQNLTLPEQ